MATPPRVSENPATQRQYVAQLTISAAMTQALAAVWEALSPTSSDSAWDSFRAAYKAIAPQYGRAAAVVSLDNYRTARADAGNRTPLRMSPLPTIPVSKIDAGLDWAGSLRAIEADQAELGARILARAEASLQKMLMDEARAATVTAVAGDEKARGYRRVPRPEACAWCITLAIRKTTRRGLAADFKRYGSGGALGDDEHWGVYKSRASAGQVPPGDAAEINRFHNNCHCVVEPIFDTSFSPPAWLQEMSNLYENTEGGLNEFRRALSARRGGTQAPDPRPSLSPTAVDGSRVAAIADLLADIDAAMTAA